MSEDGYTPAQDPGGNRPGGDRVRFETDVDGVEQSIFGGSAADIEKSILEDSAVNFLIIRKTVHGIETIKDDLGAGMLREVIMDFTDGTTLRFTWTERGLAMAVKES